EQLELGLLFVAGGFDRLAHVSPRRQVKNKTLYGQRPTHQKPEIGKVEMALSGLEWFRSGNTPAKSSNRSLFSACRPGFSVSPGRRKAGAAILPRDAAKR